MMVGNSKSHQNKDYGRKAAQRHVDEDEEGPLQTEVPS